MRRGYIAMVLHAHLPFVRHEEQANALEERWLFEALSETYLPLLMSWERLQEQGIPFAFAMTVSPTLLTLLTDEEMAARYVRHLELTIELTEKEMVRTRNHLELHSLAVMYHTRHIELLERFEGYGRNIVPALVRLADAGHLELLTCGATHGFLPVLGTAESRQAQIRIAVETHRRLTGRSPRGIWLPECGYVPGIESVLEREGLQFFLVDSHAFADQETESSKRVYGPVFVGESNVYALARDPEAARQVWSSFTGYPGDPDYREYYRDIGFDLEWDYIRPYVHPEGIRLNTGIKYHRITAQGDHKELYNPEWAAQKTRGHAAHFIESRYDTLKRLEQANIAATKPPLIVAPYDAELFGHWWFEGPQWLEQVALQMHDTELRLVTPSQYLDQFPEAEAAHMSMSSWGRAGYADVWLNETNDWIYPHLHRVEQRLVNLIRQKKRDGMDRLTEAALQQLAREVLLAESSDWAFIMTMGTTVEYAVRRTKLHLEQAMRLADSIESGMVHEAYLRALEQASPIFPDLNLEAFLTEQRQTGHKLRILMLSWEFPPRTVGGLARAVYDLSRALVDEGVEVHVVTCHGDDTAEFERVDGVYVHRVEAPSYAYDDFVQWSAVLNIRMAAMGSHVLAAYGPFDLIHAHDWLAAEAGQLLAETSGCPLVSTIHATEHGRNHGIHNGLQQRISHIEWKLAYESSQVIVCSQYMKGELHEVYGVPANKLHVLPNGIDHRELERGLTEQELTPAGSGASIFYVGRLVTEKGVQVLIEAAPDVLLHHPDTKFRIAGKGPMLAHLKSLADELGVSHAVEFLGFVTDEERNRLFKSSDVAVFPSLYEPFGIVALEAMGLGTPTVVSRTGGLAEIIEHGVDGWLAEPGEASSLAGALLQVLGNREESRQVAERGYQKTIHQYGWAAIARDTVTVYEQALARQAIHIERQRA